MAASSEGHVDIIKMLIEAKAHVNKQDEVRHIHYQKTHCTASYHRVPCYMYSK